jgi:NAD(P)H-quinone oxidoreductase subunit 5
MNSSLLWLIALGPLALAGIGLLPQANANPKRIARLGLFAAVLTLALALGAAALVTTAGPQHTATLGVMGAGIGLYIDALSAIMFVLVAFVGATVIRYSDHYLDGDPNHGIFLQRLCLTVAAVLVLVVSGNLLLLTLAWIATSVGLNSLLLFYGDRQSAILAARKKFAISRIGDVALIGAAVLLFSTFGGFDYVTIFAGAEAMAGNGATAHGALMAASLLIAIAALLKSAQFPLHGWLLEVMETPTPVSALLHAGIINAGGFLVLRLADVMALSTPALDTLAIVGGLTALFGSLVMLTQTSIKVSLAYSTIAQMGFMLLQVGLGAFASALLHIVAHSLYKAHAFLSSGSVIDVLRTSWTPSPGGQPHPARLAIALAAVLAVAFAASNVFGATITEKPGVFALGAVMLMGLTLLLANAIDERPNSYVIGRTALIAAAVAALYFGLQNATEWLLAGTVPSTQALRGPFDLAVVVIVIVAFAGVTILQSELARQGALPFWRSLYVHLANGFYVNTIANRWALRFWPTGGAVKPSNTDR